jgi:hypothetical protein
MSTSEVAAKSSAVEEVKTIRLGSIYVTIFSTLTA